MHGNLFNLFSVNNATMNIMVQLPCTLVWAFDGLGMHILYINMCGELPYKNHAVCIHTISSSESSHILGTTEN